MSICPKLFYSVALRQMATLNAPDVVLTMYIPESRTGVLPLPENTRRPSVPNTSNPVPLANEIIPADTTGLDEIAAGQFVARLVVLFHLGDFETAIVHLNLIAELVATLVLTVENHINGSSVRHIFHADTACYLKSLVLDPFHSL